MKFDQFIGQVQHRGRLADGGQALRAVQATLETLNERLIGGEGEDLAAQLPAAIGHIFKEPVFFEKRSLQEFFETVALREGVSASEGAYHACAVISVLYDAVSEGEMNDIRSQLPREYDQLFELALSSDARHRDGSKRDGSKRDGSKRDGSKRDGSNRDGWNHDDSMNDMARAKEEACD